MFAPARPPLARRPAVVAAPLRCVTVPAPGRRPLATRAEPASLYDRLGGQEPVNVVTSMLFDRLIEDPTLGHFFDKSTLGKHKAVVSRFLAQAFGGPAEYKGRNMVDAHVGLVGLQHPRDFLIVANTLDGVLTDAGVGGDLKDEVMAVAGSLEPQFAKVAKFRAAIEADAD